METLVDLLKTLPTPFNFVAILGIFAILCGSIYACYTSYLTISLKREMLNKGMSAKDIERVMNAGKQSPAIEDQSSDHEASSHTPS